MRCRERCCVGRRGGLVGPGGNQAKAHASQFELLADYNLSKLTDEYIGGDYSLCRGNVVGAQLQGIDRVGLAQKETQLGLMAGIRQQF